jgi:hypothetical protein
VGQGLAFVIKEGFASLGFVRGRTTHVESLAMRRCECTFVVVFCLCIVSLSWSQEKQPSPDSRGAISEGNKYTNPALGVTIRLPGEWRMTEMTSETPNDPSCAGPLCGSPDINAILESQPGSSPNYRLYLSGWKLSQQYLNRNRNPLRWFAGIMLEGSMGSDVVPLEKQTALQLRWKASLPRVGGRSRRKYT